MKAVLLCLAVAVAVCVASSSYVEAVSTSSTSSIAKLKKHRVARVNKAHANSKARVHTRFNDVSLVMAKVLLLEGKFNADPRGNLVSLAGNAGADTLQVRAALAQGKIAPLASAAATAAAAAGDAINAAVNAAANLKNAVGALKAAMQSVSDGGYFGGRLAVMGTKLAETAPFVQPLRDASDKAGKLTAAANTAIAAYYLSANLQPPAPAVAMASNAFVSPAGRASPWVAATEDIFAQLKALGDELTAIIKKRS